MSYDAFERRVKISYEDLIAGELVGQLSLSLTIVLAMQVLPIGSHIFTRASAVLIMWIIKDNKRSVAEQSSRIEDDDRRRLSNGQCL